MEKNIKDYLHLYLGCDVEEDSLAEKCKRYKIKLTPSKLRSVLEYNNYANVKPILRPLSDMTEEEMISYLQIIFSDVDDKIDADEFDLEMFYNDGGSMVDGDIEVGANISCRCYEGQIAIRNCGSTFLFDDSGELTRVINIPEGIRLLLSKHFDLFGLIESGLAIDKTKQLAK